jgi:hypothetical protein
MSMWALGSWNWMKSGAIVSDDFRSSRVPPTSKWFRTKHPWGQRLGIQISAQIVQLQIVLESFSLD